MSHTVEKSIDIQVPIKTVYNQWTQFEEFPEFMDGVREVKQLDNKRLHWTASIGGKEKQWEAVIVEQTPETRIAWRSATGAENSGIVSFVPIDSGTRVTVRITYDTEGIIEKTGDALGFLTRRVEGDLQRFKEFIESRGRETAAWRGEIHAGKAKPAANPGLGGATSTGTSSV